MERKALEKMISAGKIQGVYLFEGPDENLKKDMLQKMTAALFQDGMADFNSAVLEGSSPEEIMMACDTLPMISEKRLVTVMDDPSLVGGREVSKELLSYIRQIPDTCVLVFYCHGKVDNRRQMVKAISQCGQMVSFRAMEGRELTDWICDSFRELGYACSGDAAEALVFTSGSDSMLLKQEIAKLAGDAGDRKQILPEDIRNIATRSQEYRTWEMTDAVVSGRTEKAFHILSDMLNAGESEFMIIYILGSQYRDLMKLSMLRAEGKKPQEMAAITGMRDFVIRERMKHLNRYTEAQLRQCISLCLETDYRLKSGQMAQNGCVENLLFGLIQIQKQGRTA